MEYLEFLAGSALSLLQLFLILFTAACFTQWYIPTESRSIKVAAALVVSFWIPLAIFFLTIPFGVFNRPVTTGALFALSAVAYALNGRRFPATPRLPQLRRPKRITFLHVLVAFFSLVLLMRFARGLIAPPLAWDALTYHLLKAGRWVQTGGWVTDNAPDSWQFYEWFPPAGDVYWAWTMLGTHTDALLPHAGLGILSAIAAGAYAVCRTLGNNVERSILAALCVVSVPAVTCFLTANYVDNTALAEVLLGSALLLKSGITRSAKLAGLSAVSFALAVAIKITFIPFLGVSTFIFGWLWWGPKSHRLIAGVSAAIVLALGWQLYLIYSGHTPFYPMPLSIAGFSIEPGLDIFTRVLYTSKHPFPYSWELPMSLMRFHVKYGDYQPNHLNFTFMFPVLVACVFAVSGRIFKQLIPLQRLCLLGLVASATIIAVTFWTPGAVHYREIWLTNMGRFMTPLYALLIAALALPTYNWITYLLFVTAIVNSKFDIPNGYLQIDWEAVLYGLAPVTFLVVGIFYWYGRPHNKSRAAALAASLVIPILIIQPVREQFRWQFFNSTYTTGDVEMIFAPKLSQKMIQIIESSSGSVVDYTVNNTGIYFYWFRYMFLGSHLQNKVIYIPPTRDGRPLNYTVDKLRPLDYSSWLARVVNAGVDYLVSVDPYAEEVKWAHQHPEHFTLIDEGPTTKSIMFRVNR